MQKKPIWRIFMWVVFIFLAFFIFVGMYFLNTGFGKCYLVNYTNFIQNDKNMFISPKMPKFLYPTLQNIIKQAKKRNAEFWGEFTATPTIIFCANAEEYKYFGAMPQAPAMVYMSFLGAYIVVQPDGADVDVIAHEYCHAELQKRIGWWRKSMQIPAWFDEGLALQLDYRYPNNTNDNSYKNYKNKWNSLTENGKFAPKLDELTNISGFFKGNFKPNIAYLTSGMYVKKWLEKNGKNAILDFVEKINQGKDFKKAFE
jgi:hypothetical protein